MNSYVLSHREEIRIEDAASPPICSSCQKLITPNEYGVEFPCPNCGKTIIRRCKRCRKLSVEYNCPACGFKGP
ncbi:MAG: zinc finger domain-containing protein [Desulfurococcaceae archaeon]